MMMIGDVLHPNVERSPSFYLQQILVHRHLISHGTLNTGNNCLIAAIKPWAPAVEVPIFALLIWHQPKKLEGDTSAEAWRQGFFIQNQTGNHPGKWDRTGEVVV